MVPQLCAGALLAFPLVVVIAQEARDDRPLSEDLAAFHSEDTLIYVEAPGLAGLFERGLEDPFVARLLESPLGRRVTAEMDASPEELLAYVERELGIDPLPTLGSLFAEGATLGVSLRLGQPAWLVVARGDDAERWRETLEVALREAASEAGHPGAFDEPTFSRWGADVWMLDEACVALHESTLVAGSSRAMVRQAFGRSRSGRKTLNANPRFQSNERTDALARMWADVDQIERLANAGSDGGKFAQLRQAVTRPEVHLVLGPELAAITQADSATLHVGLDGTALSIQLTGEDLDLGPLESMLPPALAPTQEAYGVGPMPRSTPDELARGVLYRDFHQVFAQRTELFPPEVVPRFSAFADQIAIFFGGLDVEEELLPELSPWIRMVARPVEFTHGVEPEIPLPGVAVLVDVKDAERMGPYLLSGFQSAISIISVDRGQKGLPPLLMGMELADGVEITKARFLPPLDGEGVDARFNLEPACAMVNGTFVLGTHASIVRETAVALKRGDVVTTSTDSGWITVRGAGAADFLRENLDALVMSNVLEEGISVEEARANVEGLVAIADMIGQVSLQTRRTRTGGAAIEVTIDLEDPLEKR